MTRTGVELMKSLDSPLSLVTDGVADWLARLLEVNPNLAPRRTGSSDKDPTAAAWLRRFVREVVTVNPVTRDLLSDIQLLLIESALDGVDWNALARHPRFSPFDWSHARLTYP